MQDFLAALALVLVIEGLLWAAIPDRMKDAAHRATQFDSSSMRVGGLAAAMFGVFAMWMIRG